MLARTPESTPGPTTSGPDVLACPVCSQPLRRHQSSARCTAGHLFDVAREGYVNLLLPQHRHSRDPGYNKAMIAGRRDFFDAGHYEGLADDVARVVADHLHGDRQVVLDAGCGEGYYLRRLREELTRQAHPETLLVGLDISKHGVRVAARRDGAGVYAVAGTFRMPVLAGSVDVLLTHFSPVSADDFARVLPPGGTVVVGGPGEGHLFGFKELLYDNPARHAPTDHFVGDPRFELLSSFRSRHRLSLRGADQVANLLVMTPFYWTLDERAQARLAQVEQVDTEIDVLLRSYRRTPAEPQESPDGSGRPSG
jgi:23S rRNA (guanine745-N1)-methyltransferase